MPAKINKTSLNLLIEPFKQEVARIRTEEFDQASINFAYELEALKKGQRANKRLISSGVKNIYKETNKFYDRFYYEASSSIGILLTNIDKSRIRSANGQPSLYVMGPERIKLALAQRAMFFLQNQNGGVHKLLANLEKSSDNYPKRSNLKSLAIEAALGMDKTGGIPIRTPAFTEIGYKKISSDKRVSRNEIVNSGLFNIVGKYPRKIIGIGAMPPVSGWRDVIVISALGHMLSFAPRSSIYQGDVDLRVNLINSARDVIDDLDIKQVWKKRAQRNIGASLGIADPKAEVKIARALHQKAGVRLFRIYTIGSDPLVIETAKLLRKDLGKDIEIFVGQIADIKQAERLVEKDVRADGLIYGHGGGQQCTSATNGMALTNLEDLYLATRNKKLNRTSIIAEGGIGRSIGTALLMGVDAALGNQKLIRGTIETMNLFIKDKKGDICQPYPGTASPVTQLIEAEDTVSRANKLDPAGRTYQSEGKPGFMYYKNKANSAAFWINQYLNHAARTLADLGVSDIQGLREMLKKNNTEYFRILTDRTRYVSSAHRDVTT